jgi:DNA polymerase III subunit delta'
VPWGSVRGHDAQVEALRRAIVADRFPHAFLLVGPAGVGKGLFARTLAQALLCEKNPELALEPCGRCPSCLQIVEGSHPDVLRVGKPEDRQELPIRAIRDLCIDLGLKPMRGHRRVAIVEDADDLSEEAANAFLKTLEEPPPGSVLMLIGESPDAQIATIVSRCRVLRFQPLSAADLTSILRDEGLVSDPAVAADLAERSEGSVARAKALADPEVGPFRREMIDTLSDPEGFDPLRLAARMDVFCKEGGKEAGPQRERAFVLLGELARLWRGVLWQTAGLEPPSSDPGEAQAIASLAARLEPEDVFILADRCLTAVGEINRNASRTLVIQSLARDMARTIHGR